MEIIGVDDDGFFSTYEVEGQISLEHYNPESKRFWATALLPKTPEGKNATFQCVQMLKGNLYMISSSESNGKTQVYAQEINHNGNYTTEIIQIVQDASGSNIHMAKSPDQNAISIVVSDGPGMLVTVTLLTAKLNTRWTQSITSDGEVQELLVKQDGTTYVLIRSTAAAPSTSAFYLHQLLGKAGSHSKIELGHTNYRPLKAKLAVTPKGHVIVSGYVSPSNSVASHHPEPVGTFLYRVEKHNLQDRFAVYTPFNKKFVRDYKRFKPDNDNSQRLRNLQLDKIIPLQDGSIYLLGEVCEDENRAGTFVYHNNDIIITRLHRNGSPVFTTSVTKLQSGTNKQNTIRSYFATTVGDTLKIIYLNFDHNRTFEDKIAMYSPRSSFKTPVLLTIGPNGDQKVKLLHNTQTGQDQGFYLRPCSAYKVKGSEYIIIGMGPKFYRYGSMIL
ncbi:hypothetical protein GCM10027293_35480 [Pontibacter aydingkolensis]